MPIHDIEPSDKDTWEEWHADDDRASSESHPEDSVRQSIERMTVPPVANPPAGVSEKSERHLIRTLSFSSRPQGLPQVFHRSILAYRQSWLVSLSEAHCARKMTILLKLLCM